MLYLTLKDFDILMTFVNPCGMKMTCVSCIRLSHIRLKGIMFALNLIAISFKQKTYLLLDINKS